MMSRVCYTRIMRGPAAPLGHPLEHTLILLLLRGCTPSGLLLAYLLYIYIRITYIDEPSRVTTISGNRFCVAPTPRETTVGFPLPGCSLLEPRPQFTCLSPSILLRSTMMDLLDDSPGVLVFTLPIISFIPPPCRVASVWLCSIRTRVCGHRRSGHPE